MKFIKRLFEVNVSDPDDARRRKLLNILLVGVGTLTSLALLWALSGIAVVSSPEVSLIRSAVFVLVGVIISFIINRYQYLRQLRRGASLVRAVNAAQGGDLIVNAVY
jgi:hypothetical protein